MGGNLRSDEPLRKLFSGAIEQVFQVDIGICDPALTDYLAELLTDFIHVDRIYRLQTLDGTTIRDVSRMAAEAAIGPSAEGTRRTRLVNKYIGDFTLFWTGIYPESLRPRRGRGRDRLQEYLLHGKRSYGIASELTAADEQPPARLLQNLSAQFECCVHGLHLVRASWEQLALQRDN